MNLIDGTTGKVLRPATRREWAASFLASGSYDVPRAGVVRIDGQAVYVEGDPSDDEIEALQTAAGAAGDYLQCCLCAFVLAGWYSLNDEQQEELLAAEWHAGQDEPRARHECWRVIAEGLLGDHADD